MSLVPETLKGKEFEELIMEAGARERKSGSMTLGRYGVQGMVVQGKTLLVPSLPDFEGVLAGGRQFIIEAKVCSSASLQLDKKVVKPRQISHMLERSAMGAQCFLLVHFCARKLQNATQPAFTVALPVTAESSPVWQRFVDIYAEASRLRCDPTARESISRDLAYDMGIIVPWVAPKGCRKALPDLLSLLWPQAKDMRQTETEPDHFQPTLFTETI